MMEDAVPMISRTSTSGILEDESRARPLPCTDFRQVVELLPVAVYICEAPAATITYFNRHAALLWGRTPRLNDTEFLFCGSHKLYRPDGSRLPHDQTPMAIALREGRACQNQEVVIEREDGSRITVLVNIDPIRDADGNVKGAVNAFHENVPSRQAELTQAHLAAIIDSSDDAIISKDLSSVILSWNSGAERIFGYTAQEAIGKSITMLIPADRQQEEVHILERLRRGERIDHFETIRVRKDGGLLDISLSVSPIRDRQGRVVGASKIARDVTERKRTEQALRDLERRYLEALEEKYRKTSVELVHSQERLRHSERLAGLGTLSAGLGHDMGNVLMPLTAHLNSIAAMAPGNGLHEHFESIRKSVEYLRTLAGGLRMLATDHERQLEGAALVELSTWWHRAEPLLKTALGRRFTLEHDIPDELPPLAIHGHLLMQVIFNLVQNAGQAMASSSVSDGRVRVSARLEAGRIQIAVADNGPGMTDIVKERCFEPYFTTKTRGISTGMGLALVHGIVQSVGGTIDVESQPGAGATFKLSFPAARPGVPRPKAISALVDERLRAVIDHLLTTMDFDRETEGDHAQLLITDDDARAEQFLSARTTARALVFGPQSPGQRARGKRLPVEAKVGEIRAALRELADSGRVCCP